ncbi:MAG: HAMP domain-containing protein [Burkholderiaceae bacterium]|nr:HAMP domain-containing protein [Burkholderiaceae bacterium]
MQSIHVRMVVMFVVIVTAVLGLSGTYSQFKLSEELEQRDAQLRKGVLTRLQISLPAALWNLDKPKVGSLLEAEMLVPEVLAIRVYDTTTEGLFSGKMRNPSGQIVSSAPNSAIEGDATEAMLTFRGVDPEVDSEKPVTVGRVVINFSRGQIKKALSAELIRKAVEIVVLDLILVLALTTSLRLIFKPLKQLHAGLFELATRETDKVEELPERRRDEIGDLARGFNHILRRLRSIIEQTRQAEEAAKQASAQTAQALQELRQAQDSLVQSERLASLGALVAGIAHEINTPVGISLTSASVLLEETSHLKQALNAGSIKKSDILAYVDTASEGARLIMANADRAAQLIQSFKQIAVDQTNEMRRPFNLKEYIDEVIMSLHPRLKHTNINVVVECPQEIELDSYPGAFAQVLTNLTLNALTHAYDPGSVGCIHIAALRQDDNIDLSFRDDGKGIAAEHLEKIFDPFFTTQRGRGGTGLGLNIVFNLIVKRFGGTIGVESALGKGTAFRMRMPRVATAELIPQLGA